MFQFQTGSIKSERGSVIQEDIEGFNSKLVRLKVRYLPLHPSAYKSFNSKLVRLKVDPDTLSYLTITFQFQTGSIKSLPSRNLITVSRSCFNSKLVRLKVMNRQEPYGHTIEFQFQTGSIKRKTPQHACHSHSSVSIPNWFD